MHIGIFKTSCSRPDNLIKGLASQLCVIKYFNWFQPETILLQPVHNTSTYYRNMINYHCCIRAAAVCQILHMHSVTRLAPILLLAYNYLHKFYKTHMTVCLLGSQHFNTIRTYVHTWLQDVCSQLHSQLDSYMANIMTIVKVNSIIKYDST